MALRSLAYFSTRQFVLGLYNGSPPGDDPRGRTKVFNNSDFLVAFVISRNCFCKVSSSTSSSANLRSKSTGLSRGLETNIADREVAGEVALTLLRTRRTRLRTRSSSWRSLREVIREPLPSLMLSKCRTSARPFRHKRSVKSGMRRYCLRNSAPVKSLP